MLKKHQIKALHDFFNMYKNDKKQHHYHYHHYNSPSHINPKKRKKILTLTLPKIYLPNPSLYYFGVSKESNQEEPMH